MTQAWPVEKVVTTTRPGRALARRFVAGDTLDEAIEVSRALNGDGFLVSLDHLGEEVHDEDSAIQATDEYLESLDRITSEGLHANISIKATQLGLAIDEDLALDSISRLAERAKTGETTVTIDMEDSRYTDATVRLFEKAQRTHGNLGLAVQSYMRRTADDLSRLLLLGGHIRLCKGAYVESGEIAFQNKEEVDSAYADHLRLLMREEGIRPAVATHDSRLIELARQLARDRQNYYEFQMLYGVRKDVQRQLVEDGIPVRIYLPYGSQWYPYLTRRLAERPANAWFFVRAAVGS